MTNISRKEQKAKLFTLNKDSFVDELMNLEPKDYAERNWFYQKASLALSYPLQLISILAGSYLLFQMASFVWHVDLLTTMGGVVFALCMFIFLGVEALRRWLVNTTGHHYVATYSNKNGKINKGEWLGAKRFWLIIISAVLVSTGTLGIYEYIKNNQPEAKVVSVKEATSPIQNKIAAEKNRISSIDAERSQIQASKAKELKDPKNYNEWNGKQFLLPEVKNRHQNYDKQLTALNKQREAHLGLIAKYEDKLSIQETKAESKNQEAIEAHSMSIETYAAIGAGIWLTFEIVLMFMLSYTWVYKYGVKKEMLLRNKKSNNKPKVDLVKPQDSNAKKPSNAIKKEAEKAKKENEKPKPKKENTGTVEKKQEKKPKEKLHTHREFMQYVKNRTITNAHDRVKHAQLKEILDGFPEELNQKLWKKLIDRVNFVELQNKQHRLDKEAEAQKKKEAQKAKAKKVPIDYQTTDDFLAFVKRKFQKEIQDGLVKYSDVEKLVREKCPQGGITNELAAFIVEELEKYIHEAKQEIQVSEVYGFKRFQDMSLPQNQHETWVKTASKVHTNAKESKKKTEIVGNIVPDLDMANEAKAKKNANKWKLSDSEVIELRNETGLSYAKIAEISGMSASRVSKLCNGKIEPKS